MSFLVFTSDLLGGYNHAPAMHQPYSTNHALALQDVSMSRTVSTLASVADALFIQTGPNVVLGSRMLFH